MDSQVKERDNVLEKVVNGKNFFAAVKDNPENRLLALQKVCNAYASGNLSEQDVFKVRILFSNISFIRQCEDSYSRLIMVIQAQGCTDKFLAIKLAYFERQLSKN